jgi:hypothetical protein
MQIWPPSDRVQIDDVGRDFKNCRKRPAIWRSNRYLTDRPTDENVFAGIAIKPAYRTLP